MGIVFASALHAGLVKGGIRIEHTAESERSATHGTHWKLRGLKADQVEAVSRSTLDALIDQELALQAATEMRIDRDPAVLMAVEAARRDIIARAYAERLSEGAHAPTPEEVKQYYRSRPALFAQRRLYTLVDAAVEAKPSEVDALRGSLLTAHTQAEITRR
jgi:EpsD family peptidyl-prolyl cis-trans isomerase